MHNLDLNIETDCKRFGLLVVMNVRTFCNSIIEGNSIRQIHVCVLWAKTFQILHRQVHLVANIL